MSSPWIDSSLSARHSSTEPFHSQLPPGRALGGKGDDLGGRKAALGEDLEDRRPDRAGRAEHPDSVVDLSLIAQRV